MTSKNKKWTDEQKKNWSEKCKILAKRRPKRHQNLSNEQKAVLRKKSQQINEEYWTPEKKRDHSVRMKQIVAENPDSYSKENVSGRAKLYETVDSYGETKVKGSWELMVAEWLNRNGIKWTNRLQPFSYKWKDNTHVYFPDFYLEELDVYLEVKGYETARDRAKWDAVNRKFYILKRKEIDNLDEVMKTIAGMVLAPDAAS